MNWRVWLARLLYSVAGAPWTYLSIDVYSAQLSSAASMKGLFGLTFDCGSPDMQALQMI